MLTENLRAIQTRIQAACTTNDIDSKQIGLLAVSKTFSAERVREAFDAGLREFGENYVQEGVEKIAALSDLRSAITWHFIGPLQSNKTKDVAEHFDWMHTVDREKIARRLSEQRPPHLKPLQICIQVNISAEESKSGVLPQDALDLALTLLDLPGVTLRGLMAIPQPSPDPVLQRQSFQQLAALFDQIRSALPDAAQAQFNILSMGMSDDLEAAIAESLPQATTLLRVGSALFGQRAITPR
jgi:PLP dependent protein